LVVSHSVKLGVHVMGRPVWLPAVKFDSSL